MGIKMRGIGIGGLVVGMVLLWGCCSEREEEMGGRTVLVYMAADNSLDGFAADNLADMVSGAAGGGLRGGHLLVYVDGKDRLPVLYHIEEVGGGNAEAVVVRRYEEQNSGSVETLRGVMEEVFGGGYEAESYGLVLWSHGTGWLPSDLQSYLRAFGQDTEGGGSSWMELGDLQTALEGYALDFIAFDACYMGSVEVAYALRGNASYILSSPTEIMAGGLPYGEMVRSWFSGGSLEERMLESASAFYRYYSEGADERYRSASVSVVRTSALDSLAGVCRGILSGRMLEASGVNTSGLQGLEYLSSNLRVLYDFGDFMGAMSSSGQYEMFKERLGAAVVYKATTEQAYFAAYGSLPVDTAHFCGLSVYVPQGRLGELNRWYEGLDWYKAVYQ